MNNYHSQRTKKHLAKIATRNKVVNLLKTIGLFLVCFIPLGLIILDWLRVFRLSDIF